MFLSDISPLCERCKKESAPTSEVGAEQVHPTICEICGEKIKLELNRIDNIENLRGAKCMSDNQKYLWKFSWDCGRQGYVDGLFVATESEINDALDKKVYFGEILGKHSEVYGTLELADLKKMDLDSETVEKVTQLLGDIWSGYNPLEYIDSDDDDEDDEEEYEE